MYLWTCNLAHWVKEHYFAAVKIPSHVIMSCVTQTKNFNTLWTRQAVTETAFKFIVFLASVGHPDAWTSVSKISVQPHIFITYAVISDTYMHNSGAPRAKRACGAPWVNKSTHPRKFGNHVTDRATDRATDRPSAPQAYQCLLSHFLVTLGAQEKADCTSMLSSIDSCQNKWLFFVL